MIELRITQKNIDELDNRLALALLFEDIRPLKNDLGILDWRFNGELSRLIIREHIQGKLGEALLMPSKGRIFAQELMLLGLGRKEEITEFKVPKLLNTLVDFISKKKSESFCVNLDDLSQSMFEWRNNLRKFVSLMGGLDRDLQISIIAPEAYVSDARRRQMDFAHNVKVTYH